MPEKKWFWTEAMDALLRRMYDPAVIGRAQEIAQGLRMPRWAVNRRGVALGLRRPKDGPWTAQEEAYLEGNFHHVSVKALARKLGRSPTAMKLKAKRLGLRKYDESYTACSLSEALGVDPHCDGPHPLGHKLRASHRRTERTAPQGGDSWLITDGSVVDFLREHPYDIDLRKVDTLWFMDLIAPHLHRSATSSRRAEAA